MVDDSYDFLFIGDHTHAVDSKNRVMLPLSFRRNFPSGTEDRIVLLRGTSGCIEAHVRPEWRQHIMQFRNLGRYNKEDRTLRRLVLSGATELELDGQSRVLMPKKLTDMAGIGSEARFIGLGPFFEIWNPQRYDDFVVQHGSLYDELMERLDGRRAVQQKAAEHGAQDQHDVPSAGNGA